MEYLYHPRLSDGRKAPLGWQVQMLRTCLIQWPLADGAPLWFHFLERFYIVFSSLLFIYVQYADFVFFYRWFPDINEILTCFATYQVLLESQLRFLHMANMKSKLRIFLDKFYKQFYIENSKYPHIYRTIRLKLWPTLSYSLLYFLTNALYFVAMVPGWLRGERGLMFKQAWHYDHRPLPIYIPHMFINIWLGYVCVSQFYGETNLLSQCILHLNGRYELLQEDLERYAKDLLKTNIPSSKIAQHFQIGLLKFIKRNADLNEMLMELEELFTFSIFIMFSMSSIVLCIITYNTVSVGLRWDNCMYICWIIAKICELFVIGELGSTLNKTTDNLSTVYYLSHWHEIILKSSNTVENVRLMKLVLLAMQVNSRPLNLTGLKFFAVSLGAVISILQGGFSYFTFLHTVG